MRALFTKSLELIIQIAIVLIHLGALISGWQTGGVLGAIGGLIGAFLFSIVVFGALFVLLDIAENTRRTAEAIERQSSQPDR